VLNVGDVLSFGRVRFRVKSLDADMYGNIENLIHSRKFNGKGYYANSSPESKSSSEKLTTDDSPPSSKTSSDEKSGIEDVVCRICLDGTSNEEDPIVHICKCSGSIKNIHVKCLKRWYTDRIVAKSSRCLLSYYWEKLTCELCKEDIASKNIFDLYHD
jgi:E3 ubiquitin-protein ligase DOA10